MTQTSKAKHIAVQRKESGDSKSGRLCSEASPESGFPDMGRGVGVV